MKSHKITRFIIDLPSLPQPILNFVLLVNYMNKAFHIGILFSSARVLLVILVNVKFIE